MNPFGGLEEYAASLSGSPVSIKGKHDRVGMQEEYEASLSDAPIAVYGKENSLFQNFFYPPIYLDYWSYPYLNYFQYGKCNISLYLVIINWTKKCDKKCDNHVEELSFTD